jgi:hypothetical protein
MATTLATLLPELPSDLVHVVLDYAPGLALELPAHERIQVVRRLTGLMLSDERASLMLEQRDLGHCAFYNLTLATDEQEWIQAVYESHSIRAFDELVRVGFKFDKKVFVFHALQADDDIGLALAQHLEHTVDVLCDYHFESFVTHVKHSPTIQYLLHRLLDPSFDRLNQCCYLPSDIADALSDMTPSPLDLLLWRLYRINFVTSETGIDTWTSFPLFEALVVLKPDVIVRLLHLDVLCVMSATEPSSCTLTAFDFLRPGLRPPGVFGWHSSSSFSGRSTITYGPFTQSWTNELAHTEQLCEWIVDDWLLEHANQASTNSQARQTCLIENLAGLRRAIGHYPRILAKLEHHVPPTYDSMG